MVEYENSLLNFKRITYAVVLVSIQHCGQIMLRLIRFLLHFNGALCKFARPSTLNAKNQENFSFGAMRGSFYCRKQKYSPRVAPLQSVYGCTFQEAGRLRVQKLGNSAKKPHARGQTTYRRAKVINCGVWGY